MTKNHSNISVTELKKRSEKAFERLYKSCYDELFRFAVSYVMDREIAHDVVHDTFLSLLENLNTMSEISDVRGYLYLTVKNKCLNLLKHDKVVTKNISGVIDSINDAHFGNNHKEDIESKLIILIDKLPKQQQLILKMKFLNKSYEEIADELQLSKGTVSVHVKRAYKFIRDNLLLFLIIFLKNLYLIFS